MSVSLRRHVFVCIEGYFLILYHESDAFFQLLELMAYSIYNYLSFASLFLKKCLTHIFGITWQDISCCCSSLRQIHDWPAKCCKLWLRIWIIHVFVWPCAKMADKNSGEKSVDNIQEQIRRLLEEKVLIFKH